MMNPGSSEIHPVNLRAGAALLVAIAVAVSGLLAIGGTDADAFVKPKIKQPKCGKIKKAAKKKECEDNILVRKAIGNSRFFGTRADGEAVDTLYCYNGIHQKDVRLDRYNRNVRTVGWRVESAEVKSKENFTAILFTKEGKTDFVQSISRKGDVWKIGTTKGKKIKALGVAAKEDGRIPCSDFGVTYYDNDPIPAPEEPEEE